MKKLPALLLSMIMALSLAIPAFADDPGGPAPVDVEPGFWTQDAESGSWEPAPVYTPGDAIPINAVLGGSYDIIGGADEPTGEPADGEVDWNWEDFAYGGFDWYTAEKEYLDSRPGLEEQLRANAYSYFEENYYGYGSAQEYMELAGMTEEEFLEQMVLAQTIELVEQEQWKEYLDSQKKALGGVPGQIGVMVNGQYIQFPDAAPEITGSRTMVPVRPIVEAMDGEVSFEDGKIVCGTDSVRLTFQLGSGEVLVEYPGGGLPGDGQMFPLDCAPYIKDGRAYVPVRFLGEALGYTVGWDSLYETAVLSDADALAAEIDRSFTICNRMLANVSRDIEAGRSYSAELKCDASFTAFDTLNGDTTYTAAFTGKELFDSETDNGSYSLKLSDSIVELLAEQSGLDEEGRGRLALARETLEYVETIMTREGLLWIHAPALDEYGGAENIWIGVAGDADAAAASFDRLEGATLGASYAAMLEADSVWSWQSVVEAVQSTVGMLRDDGFTTKDGVSTLKWDVDALIARAQEQYPEEMLDEAELAGLKAEIAKIVKEFNLTLTVDRQGNAELSCLVHTLPQGLGDPSIRAELGYALSTGKVSMDLDLHMANVGQLKLTMDVTREPATQKPDGQPPEGSTIVDPAELLNP